MTDERGLGVSFDTLNDALETVNYPVAASTLLEEYGDREISHANGTATVRKILEPLGVEGYRSPDEVRQSIFNMIGEEAEGRVGYTDRESNAHAPEFEQESF